jgi:hypothetical protein
MDVYGGKKKGRRLVIRPSLGPPRPTKERKRNDTPKKSLGVRLVPGRAFV